MRIPQLILSILFTMFLFELYGQEWTDQRHRNYLDSVRQFEGSLGYERTAELMKVGMAKGGERNPEIHLDYLFSIIFQSFAMSQRDSMAVYLPKAKALVDAFVPDQMWRYYLNMGNYHFDAPDKKTASQFYLKSVNELRRIGNIERLPMALNNLAQSVRNDTARVVLRETIALADSLGQVRRAMTARVSMGNIFYLEKDFNNAASYYNEAYDLSKKENIRRSHVFNSTNMGRLYAYLGQYDKAIEFFTEALETAREVKQRRVIGAIYLQKADYEILSNRSAAAIQTLDEMVDDSLNMSTVFSKIHETLEGKLHLQQGSYGQAYLIYSKIIAEYDLLDKWPYRPDVYLGYAKCLAQQGNETDALKAIDEGLRIKSDRFVIFIQLLELKSKLLEEKGLYQSALNVNRERNVYADSLVSLNKIGIRLTEQAKATLEEQERAMVNLSNDLTEVEKKGRRQAQIIAFLIAGIIGLSLLGWFYSRHRKLKLEKDLADVKQSLLRIQINPHFIFNILNSIQSSFLQEDQEKTIHLFNKFSNLMRRVLENSTNSFIPLNEELELLINYMELEKARTNNKFDYEVQIDDSVDIYLEEVPTMVLQIFLENSVWHGVVPKEERGKILLSISKESGIIKIAIEDDGVGRSFSLKNKSKDQKEKKSMGTDLVMQRVQLLNRKFGKGLRLTIQDGKNSIGTRVELAV